MNLYSEWDADAALWLTGLVRLGLIPKGDVDTRSITDLTPGDLVGYHQVHLFSGIAGWSEALRLAGYTGPVYSGSAPCQSYSTAGKRKGTEDARDLWPHMFRLIQATKPPVIFGEQVANAIRFGWWDRTKKDLESAGYTVGAAILTAAQVGAPHIRQRLYFGGYRSDVSRETLRSFGGRGYPAGCGIPPQVDGQGNPGRGSPPPDGCGRPQGEGCGDCRVSAGGGLDDTAGGGCGGGTGAKIQGRVPKRTAKRSGDAEPGGHRILPGGISRTGSRCWCRGRPQRHRIPRVGRYLRGMRTGAILRN